MRESTLWRRGDDWSAPLTAGILRHQRRYREIAGTISRHGLGWLVQQFGLDQVPVLGRVASGRSVEDPLSQPAHLRLALEELGTTAIKLGQILSTRDDLLPPEYIAELALLREHAPPVPAEEIRAIVAEELGAPLDELFAAFDSEPLATASIGQVHAATLCDRSPVVVKVQKPGVTDQVEEDLAILQQLAGFSQRHSSLAESYDLVDLADEFAWTLRNELDYQREARNIDRVRRGFEGDSEIVIPRLYWERTSARVLTMERVEGLRIDDLEALDRAGIDRPALARRIARMVLDEVFVQRFFHADPHPGNFAVLPDGRIAVYDFGMVGRLDVQTSRGLLELISSVARSDVERIIDAAIDLEIAGPKVGRAGLRREIEYLLDKYQTRALEEYDFAEVSRDLTRLIRGRRLRLPSDLALLLKTLAMHEGNVTRLDPAFTPLEFAGPYARRAALERFLPGHWIPRLAGGGEDLLELLVDGPRRIDRLLARLEQGNLESSIRLVGFETMLRELQALVNRLVVAWLVGTSLIALSVLLAIYRPGWLDTLIGPLFWLGAAVTVVAGGILTLIVLRRRM